MAQQHVSHGSPDLGSVEDGGRRQKRLRWAIGSSTMRWMRTLLRLEAVDATLNIVLLPLHLRNSCRDVATNSSSHASSV